MSADAKNPGAILATDTSGEFDDLGAIVTAMRHMLDEGGVSLDAGDRRALFVLAGMAETKWRRLDDAMTGAKR